VLILEYLLIYIHINHKGREEFNKLLHLYIETVHYLWSDEERQLAEEKRLSSSPKIIKPPPVPPRPTAYTTILGKVEYRSNL